MKKYITTLMMLLLVGTGIARAQFCTVNYSLSYAVYASETMANIQAGQGEQTANPGSGTVLIGGGEQSTQVCTRWLAGGDCYSYRTVYDSGTVSITVNGFSKSTTYGSGSTTSTIASALASAFNADGNSPVNAMVNGNVVTLGAKAVGAGTNYSLSATSSTNDVDDFGGPSFDATPSGSTLTGGTDTTSTAHLLTSALIDGDASMNMQGSNCPDASSATHTPLASNVVNGVGGWGSGTAECVTCYLSYQNNEDSGAVDVGVPITFTAEGQVNCSVGGLIFDFVINDYLEVAYTHSIQTGVRSNCYYQINNNIEYEYCDIGLSNWCSYSTTPPDVTITDAKEVIVSPYDNSVGGYWSSRTLLGRFTTAAPYGIVVVSFGLNSADTTQLDCTDWNKQHGFGSTATYP